MMVAKDQRMKQDSEIINGIKLIKMNAWEDSFLKKVFIFLFRPLIVGMLNLKDRTNNIMCQFGFTQLYISLLCL